MVMYLQGVIGKSQLFQHKTYTQVLLQEATPKVSKFKLSNN